MEILLGRGRVTFVYYEYGEEAGGGNSVKVSTVEDLKSEILEAIDANATSYGEEPGEYTLKGKKAAERAAHVAKVDEENRKFKEEVARDPLGYKRKEFDRSFSIDHPPKYPELWEDVLTLEEKEAFGLV